ncbi:YciI family protein [Kitasatospora sp. NBC_01287]|uniref:YciI family protein n=1 Tax=Kitasatospora sp. NBC_01287 TaxID=2903573 RepID=UPI002253D53D|nr:YciI family protein [Kitasatospora sp. NBC_01287]MCX4748394.1 YciI family protein [Kitasatospora sp. NBC_01287]
MFVVTLTYTAALERIDELVPAHVEWLDQNYAAGVFLASGRRVPRTGGVILAQAASPEALAAVLAEDPFNKAGVAEYQVVEFLPTKTAPALDSLAVRAG